MGTDLRLKGRYYDLSNLVHAKMPYYPAGSPPEIVQVSSLEKGGFNVHRVTMSTHQGTHIDAPGHVSNEGATVDELDLNLLMGEGVVLDLSFKEIGSGITADDLEKFSEAVRPEDIVVLYTGCCDHIEESWINANYTHLEKSGAEWLVKKGAKSVGIDFFSIDKYGDSENPAHHTLLGNGIPLIEEISCEVKNILGKRIYLICLPIRMKDGDGAPARVIAYVLD
jgi:arylformamidase